MELEGHLLDKNGNIDQQPKIDKAVVFLPSAANDGGIPNLIATNSFNITVNPALLTIAAQPLSKVYGAADPALAFTATGFQFTDTAGNYRRLYLWIADGKVRE